MTSEAAMTPSGSPDQGRVPASSRNLPLVDEDTEDNELRALFARYRNHFERPNVPGIVRCFATTPAVLRGMLVIAEEFLFSESLLSRRNKEMIATYISSQNRCAYCADSHGSMLFAQGESREFIGTLQKGDLDPRLLTAAELDLLQFTAKVNTSASSVSRADVEAVMQSGWSEAQIAEAVHVTALFAAFNRIADGFGLPSPYPTGL